MYPNAFDLLGFSLSVWNATFLASALAGYVVLRLAAGNEPALDLMPLRYAATVYLATLAAQLFAYAFDVNTSLRPPYGIGYAAYYLNPLTGPKTLYGAVVLMPVAVSVACVGSAVMFARALDVWTPALFTVVAGARVGCFLQGCCYGVRSDWFGISLPVGSPVYYEQLRAEMITEGSRSLPVVPAQAIEAAFLAVVAAVTFKLVRSSRRVERDCAAFSGAVAAYSVFRFAIEFVRGDAERGIYGLLSTSQWIAVLVLAVSAPVLLRRVRA